MAVRRPLYLDAASGAARQMDVGDTFDLASPYVTALSADLGAISALTSFQNLTGLGVPISASATEMWLVKYWLLVSAANATMDVKFDFTVPTGCTMQWGPIQGGSVGIGGWGAAATAASQLALRSTAAVQAIGTSIGTSAIALVALVFGGGTAGTVQLQYAQNTSDAGNLQILKGSTVEATRTAS